MDKIRVLIVDDHPVFRKGLRQLLEGEESLQCIGTAENGEEVVKMAEELKPDVVIIDVDMPKMTGIEAAEQIKSIYPKTAVLVLSAYKYDHYIVNCIRAGASGYLLKTAPPEELISAICKVYEGLKVYDIDATSRILSKVVSENDKDHSVTVELHSRELEILELVAKGKTNKEISSLLSISDHTVGTHLTNIFNKLQVKSRTEAVLYALQQGLFSIDDVAPKSC
jgi:DNA-binding NarL/FixJ family response regulator